MMVDDEESFLHNLQDIVADFNAVSQPRSESTISTTTLPVPVTPEKGLPATNKARITGTKSASATSILSQATTPRTTKTETSAQKITKRFVDQVTLPQKELLDMALGKCIFGCGLPMQIVVHFTQL